MDYAITFTLRPMMYRMTAVQQFSYMTTDMLNLAKRYKMTLIAELTKEHNIHYHGIVELQNHKHLDQLLNEIRPILRIGRKEIEPVKDKDKWITYIYKEVKITAEILNESPIIYDGQKKNQANIETYLFPEDGSDTGLGPLAEAMNGSAGAE